MDACPACTASLARRGKPHCTSPNCIWLTCLACGTRIAPDLETYYRVSDTSVIWGNGEGYLKAV
jgi:hypothetical protein